MKVRDLIEKLKELDQDKYIVIPGIVKVINPKTGEDMWANVKWIEPTMMMGCGCWDGIKIIAELDV